MKIRKCPYCAQLIHFEPRPSPLICWNCAHRTDAAKLRTPGEKRWQRAVALFDQTLPMPSRLVGVARVALLCAVPIAALMLLVCNGFDIAIVRDAAAPFLMR